MKDKFDENVLKDILNNLSMNLDKYNLYNDVLFNAEEIMEIVFREYISDIEGSPCCVDKSRFIIGRIKRALKERKNIPLCQTYAEYKNNGGDLGGINETNTNMNDICYWSPKTIKDTDTAIELYFSLLHVPSYVRNMLKEKEEKLTKQKEMWNKLKDFLEEDKLFEYFEENAVYGYKNCLLSIKNKIRELEGEENNADNKT